MDSKNLIARRRAMASALTDQQKATLMAELEAGATLGQARAAAGIGDDVVAVMAFNEIQKQPAAMAGA